MLRNCLKIRHSLQILQSSCLLALVTSFGANAQVSRAPANFVPDDDKILVPMVVEKTMMDEFHEKHAHKFKNARQKEYELLAALDKAIEKLAGGST